MELDPGRMKPDLTVVGLGPQKKRRHFAGLVKRRSGRPDLDDLKARLKQVRENTLADMAALSRRFFRVAAKRRGTDVFYAKDAADAVAQIVRAIGPQKTLAVNRASVIDELRPSLEKKGYTLFSTYLSGSSSQEGPDKVLNEYWQLPHMPIESTCESFVIERAAGFTGRRDYTAVLGVTAAAAEDGSLYFFQHTANVGKMLQEARRLVLVVGIEKIVEKRDVALLQTKCMGLFGMESVLLDLNFTADDQETEKFEELPLEDLSPEIHIIILDNGRSKIARDDQFADLLMCVSCRACAKQCPTHTYFRSDAISYPRQYLWSFLVGNNDSLHLCIGCGMCHMECPLDIDIPRLVSVARGRALSKPGRRIKNRILHDAWYQMHTLSRLSTLVNFSLENKWLRVLLENVSGHQKDAWIPSARHHTFDQWIRQKQEQEGRVDK